MSNLLPPPTQPRVTQSTGPFSAQDLARTDILLIITAERPGASVWSSIPAGAQLRKSIKSRKINNLAAQTRLKNKAETLVYLAQLPGSGNGKSSVPSFALLSFAGKLAGLALADNPRSISISAPCRIRSIWVVMKAYLVGLMPHSDSAIWVWMLPCVRLES